MADHITTRKMISAVTVVFMVLFSTGFDVVAQTDNRDVIEHCSKAIHKMNPKTARARHNMLKACEANGGRIPG